MNEVTDRVDAVSGQEEPALTIVDQPSREDRGKKIGRRSLAAAGAAGALALAAHAIKGRQSESGPARRAAISVPAPLPVPANPFGAWKSPELRLARRVTMGLNEAEAARATRLGYDAYLDYQFNYAAIDDSEVEQYVARHLPTLAMDPPHVRTAHKRDQWTIYSELTEATLRRSVQSNRQLFQRMVEFWTDHFNAPWLNVAYLKIMDDRDVIRAYALDTFPTLLKATAHSSAMLSNLDNAISGKNQPNQNYARELMELMTLGVNGGYTQQDVIEVARCFTGWSFVTDYDNPAYGTFRYKPLMHDDGEKTVLGHTIPAGGGQSDGDKVLDILARHPSTADHISRKLAGWLLRYDPPPSVVDDTSRTYLATGGDVRAMIRVILRKSNLMAAPPKYKRPYHLIVSAMRSAGVTMAPGFLQIPWYDPTTGRPVSMTWPEGNGWLGQVPFQWPEPNGYPDSMEYWYGLLLPRWNFGALLAGNKLNGLSCDVSELVRARTPAGVAQAIDRKLFAGEMPSQERNDIIEFLRKTGESPIGESTARRALGLALAFPAFQWY